MNTYVTDTHSLLWYLLDSKSLGKNARRAFEEAKDGLAIIYVPAIVLAELYYLNNKRNYIADFSSEFHTIKESGQFIFVDFEADDVLDFDLHSSVIEMHDRMIVGVAKRMDAPLLSVDSNIRESGLVDIVW